MARITADGLTKRYDAVVVDELSFDVAEGTVTGFLGRNGAGKTTTLRMLLGLVTPTSGRGTVDGLPYAALPHPIRTVGAVLEASNAHPGRSGYNHLRVVAKAAGIDRRRVDEVLDIVGLSNQAGKRVAGYSLGMRQRLALATAMLGDPSVLILDEPTNGLDPPGVRWLRSLLRRLRDEGRTVLVSSHLLAEVAQIVDHVVIIDDGRLVAEGTPADLAGRFGGERRVRVRTPKPRMLLRSLRAAGIEGERESADSVVVVGTTAADVGRIAAAAGVAVYGLREEEGSLEDTFLELIGATEELR